MPKCPQCGSALSRVHRSRWQRLVYSQAYRCNRCKTAITWYYSFLHRQIVRAKFLFSSKSRCVQCGSPAVQELLKRDYVDPVSRNPLARIQKLVAAPIKRCPACRLQYYDWRPILESRQKPQG
jgi:uncharacterized protein with PIN domain